MPVHNAAPATGEKLFLGARTLAELNSPGYCPACFRLGRSVRRDMPFHIPIPGLMLYVDRHVKEAVHRALDEEGRLPSWMPPLGQITGYVRDLDYRWFRSNDARTRVTLCGVPDDILIDEDGGLHIVDYKAAAYTPGQKAVLPIYEGQLNAYAWLARRLRWRLRGGVRSLTLLYLEPGGGECSERTGEALAGATPRRLSMTFRVKPVPVRMQEQELIPALLSLSRAAVEEGEGPHREGCPEEERIANFVGAVTGDPLLAHFGPYELGVCALCKEEHILAGGSPFCRMCDMQLI